MTHFRILYSVENLVELLQVDAKTIRSLTRLGVIPSLDGYRPQYYDMTEIDEWLASGEFEKHRPPPEYEHTKGVY